MCVYSPAMAIFDHLWTIVMTCGASVGLASSLVLPSLLMEAAFRWVNTPHMNIVTEETG